MMTKAADGEIRVGVTGHRKLFSPERIRTSVRQVISEIAGSFDGCSFIIISPLAEGADCLVAQEFLKLPGCRLHVPLPFDVSDYTKDFHSPLSRKQFHDLFLRAAWSMVLPPEKDRNTSYRAVGRYVVDHSDLMIAVWNGKPARGRGGTGEVMDICRQMGKPLYWIHSETPECIERENIGGIITHEKGSFS